MFKSRTLYVIIVGCGKFGSYLANNLSREGHSVVVIDAKAPAFNELTAEFSGFVVEGDATEFAVLKEAKIHRADVFIAATENDNVNLMVAQIAKKIFQVEKVIARLWDSRREAYCRHLELEVVFPTTVVGSMLLELMIPKDQTEPGRQP
jgi:trk system potassium uptake protein